MKKLLVYAYKDMKSHHYLNMPACTGKILLAIIY